MNPNDYDMPMSPRPETTLVGHDPEVGGTWKQRAAPGYNEVAPPAQHPAEGAEGTSGGAVSVLSAPPPPSYSDNHPLSHAEVCLALDELLDRQQAHARALRRHRTGWIVSVCLLAAANAVAWLYGGILNG